MIDQWEKESIINDSSFTVMYHGLVSGLTGKEFVITNEDATEETVSIDRQEILVLSFIMGFLNPKNSFSFYGSNRTIAKAVGTSVRTVQRALHKLEIAGYIYVHIQRYAEDKVKRSIYVNYGKIRYDLQRNDPRFTYSWVDSVQNDIQKCVDEFSEWLYSLDDITPEISTRIQTQLEDTLFFLNETLYIRCCSGIQIDLERIRRTLAELARLSYDDYLARVVNKGEPKNQPAPKVEKIITAAPREYREEPFDFDSDSDDMESYDSEMYDPVSDDYE